MEFLILIILILLLFLLYSLKTEFGKKFIAQEDLLRRLEDKLEKLGGQISPSPSVTPPVEPVVPTMITSKEPEPDHVVEPGDYWRSGFRVMETKAESPASSPQPAFFERHPDLEKFIGENLVSKIGIAILVLAIAYFVKYAIDNNWIGPIGRVAVGILCGAILVGLAHYLRNIYKAFSSVLVGGGLAIFYFTITLGYQQFQLFSQPVAFVILLFITGFSVLLSLLYDRQELAVIALVGGFTSPFMVSQGSGNYHTLYIYLLLLNTGLLVLSLSRAWRILNLLAFVFTVIIFAGWLFTLPAAKSGNVYRHGFIYACVFYGLFFVINITHNIRENKKFIASDFGILLANTSLFFATGMYLLEKMNAVDYKGIFCIGMALVNLVVSYLLFRNRKVDTNILYLLIGITLTFVSLTAPIQLQGNSITLFWASETVLLYWLFRKSGIRIMQVTSLVVWVAMIISLVMDWLNVYQNSFHTVPIVFNKAFLTGLYAAIASCLLYRLTERFRVVFLLTAFVLLFFTGLLELSHQFRHHYPGTNIFLLYIILYIYLFGCLLIYGLKRFLIVQGRINAEAIIAIVCIFIYLVTIYNSYAIQANFLEKNISGGHFLAHWASSFIIGWFLLIAFKRMLAAGSEPDRKASVLTWVVSLLLVVFLSVEVNLLVNEFFYSGILSLAEIGRIYQKTGLPILWGLSSFGLMWLGMGRKLKLLRIISLSLFTVTLIKLFVFDLRNIPVAGKIAAFFCLGVLLLAVSFMYQRLKKIIIDDEPVSID